MVGTLVKFFNNDPTYKPLRAPTVGGCGTGKSFIVNTLIGMVGSLASCNDTVQIATSLGSAAFNVKGSTIHSILGVAVNHPKKPKPKCKVERATKETACPHH